MVQPEKVVPQHWIVVGVSALGISMLLWALFKRPPYAFFTALRIVVSVAAAYSAYFCWKQSRYLAPISLALIAVGAVQLFAKMHRRDWVPFNWITIALFAITIFVAFWTQLRPRLTLQEVSARARLSLQEFSARVAPIVARLGKWILIWGVIAFVAFNLFEGLNLSKEPKDPEILLSGLWWNITGEKASLALDRSSHKATRNMTRNGVTEKMEGKWTLVPNSIPPIVEVTLHGSDGNTVLRLQLVDSASDYFLAPVPWDSALLKDSWIADRDQGDPPDVP